MVMTNKVKRQGQAPLPYRVIPHDVEAKRICLWIAWISQPPPFEKLVLDYEWTEDGKKKLKRKDVPNDAWKRWSASGQAAREARPRCEISYQRFWIEELTPGRQYDLTLYKASDKKKIQSFKASAKTLPEKLSEDGKPFIVLLGSCFSVAADKGKVAEKFSILPAAEKPDIKILCGDQVYLDAPFAEYRKKTSYKDGVWPRDLLQLRFFRAYKSTWESSFGDMLSQGGNYFCADDHEMWNNAPNPSRNVRNTKKYARTWKIDARRLFEAFQTPAHENDSKDYSKQFEVPPLSFYVADTRWNRSQGEASFMRKRDLGNIQRWISNLTGPGVLVLSQPVFAKRTSKIRGKEIDYQLADYGNQYRILCDALSWSPHSIVILTGDVHFGRVASCDIRFGRLIEVISSPMALVYSWPIKAEGHPKKAPSRFPQYASKLKKDWSSTVTTEDVPSKAVSTQNHFQTLKFSMDKNKRIWMDATFWKIRQTRGSHVAKFHLY